MNMNMTSPSNVIVYCQWSLFIYNCIDSNYFVSIYYGNLFSSVIVALFSGALLLYRLRAHRDVGLFSGGLFSPLEGFLGFTFASVIMRIVCSAVFLNDVLPSNYAFRAMIEDSQWFLTEISILTYLAGVFQTIPRIAFFQPTSAISNFWIPSIHFTKNCYWFLFIFQSVFAQGSAFLYGFSRMRNHKTLSSIFLATRLLSYSITSVILALGYGIYGRLLVSLTKRSFELVRGQGGIVEEFGDTTVGNVTKDESGRKEHIKKRVFIMSKERNRCDINSINIKFKWYLRKMQMFNISATLALSFWSMMTFVLAFWQEQVWVTLAVSKAHMLMADVLTECTYFAVLTSVLLSEIRPNQNPAPLDTINTMTNSDSYQFSQSTPL